MHYYEVEIDVFTLHCAMLHVLHHLVEMLGANAMPPCIWCIGSRQPSMMLVTQFVWSCVPIFTGSVYPVALFLCGKHGRLK